MVDITIKFSNLLAEEIGKEMILTFPNRDYLTINDFLDLIKQQIWADKIIEEDHLKTSIVLIIDEEIIQFSNPSELRITEESEISCHLMFAGGL
jgi:hypothetical protein